MRINEKIRYLVDNYWNLGQKIVYWINYEYVSWVLQIKYWKKTIIVYPIYDLEAEEYYQWKWVYIF